MSSGRWFKAHRKQIVTHTAIIMGFALLTVFVIAPLFDRLERIPGESQMQRISLPGATNNVLYNLDYYGVSTGTIDTRGWAFVLGQDSEGAETYLVLKSDDESYAFTTTPELRKNVTKTFSHLNVNADSSGFYASIPLRQIPNGEYVLGIYIRKGDAEAVQYTDQAIAKTGGGVIQTLRTSIQQYMVQPRETGSLRCFVETAQDLELEEGAFLEIKGWAFIEDQDASGSTIYVTLNSALNTYVFDTILKMKPNLFEELGLNLDNSGFIARIPKEGIEAGTYKLGMYVKKGAVEAFKYTGKTVVITGQGDT